MSEFRAPNCKVFGPTVRAMKAQFFKNVSLVGGQFAGHLRARLEPNRTYFVQLRLIPLRHCPPRKTCSTAASTPANPSKDQSRFAPTASPICGACAEEKSRSSLASRHRKME